MERRKKVAIVGYTEHRALAPFRDDEWEIWGLNDLYFDLPGEWMPEPSRLRWFQMHAWQEIAHWKRVAVTAEPLNFAGGPPHPRDAQHVHWLKAASEQMPVYVAEHRDELPQAKVFPREDVYRYFSLDGVKPFRYLTNTISWMLALAIMEQVEEIGLYGVDMMMGDGLDNEYGYQRPSCEFFLGWARRAGILVHIPDESDLLNAAYVYGDPQGNAFRTVLQARLRDYLNRRGQCQQQAAMANAGNSELTGAVNTLQWILRSHMPGDSETPNRGRAPAPGSDENVREPGEPQMRTLGLIPAEAA